MGRPPPPATAAGAVANSEDAEFMALDTGVGESGERPTCSARRHRKCTVSVLYVCRS